MGYRRRGVDTANATRVVQETDERRLVKRQRLAIAAPRHEPAAELCFDQFEQAVAGYRCHDGGARAAIGFDHGKPTIDLGLPRGCPASEHLHENGLLERERVDHRDLLVTR